MQQDNNDYGKFSTQENQFDSVELRVGHIVKGIVTNRQKDMYFIQLDKKTCYLPVSEVSWTSGKSPLKLKDEIEAVVVKILDDGNVMLSVKRLQEDPWKIVLNRLYVGMKTKGKILRVMPFGLVIDLGDSITALLHKKTIGFEKDANFFDYILLGNELEVEISEINIEAKKVYLKCDTFIQQYPKHN